MELLPSASSASLARSWRVSSMLPNKVRQMGQKPRASFATSPVHSRQSLVSSGTDFSVAPCAGGER